MDNFKKKRSEVRGEAKMPAKKIRAKEERSEGGVTAQDAELEEFFVILKRLQEGFDYFQKKGTDNLQATGSGLGLWNPAFELEDFNQAADDCGGNKSATPLQKDTVGGFDLNADPDIDQESN